MAAHRRPQRKHLARPWELRGMVRCPCGMLMGTHTVRVHKNNGPYHYYLCRVRQDYKRGSCDQKMIRVDRIEPVIWSFVSGLLADPERLSTGIDAMIEVEFTTKAADPGRERKILSEKVAECVRLRTAYQSQQAAGLMTLEKLSDRLKELEEGKRLAQAELANISERLHRAEELYQDKEALLAFCSETIPEGLSELTSEDRAQVYGLLKLEISPTPEGFQVSGAFCTSELSCS